MNLATICVACMDNDSGDAICPKCGSTPTPETTPLETPTPAPTPIPTPTSPAELSSKSLHSGATTNFSADAGVHWPSAADWRGRAAAEPQR